ncbi:MAG TPA: ComF family protein [Burkholderiales bacterium]|nr:ComF family protein [Burkholderiales bacterium]
MNSCALPQQCLLCASDSRRALCDACYARLPWLGAACCPQCALPTTDGERCGGCLQRPPHFDRVVAACAYVHPLAELIRSYKYHGTLALAPLLARTLQTTAGGTADLLVPLPLSRQRLHERGFNQALEIARAVSGATGIPLSANSCRRIRDSAPQAALPWSERRKNIRGAFACGADLTGKRIAVIDDVLTTGATLDEIAKTLKRAGAAEVHGWVIARTLPP